MSYEPIKKITAFSSRGEYEGVLSYSVQLSALGEEKK